MPRILPHSEYRELKSTATHKMDQLRYQLNDLRQQLNVMVDENIYFKNRLSQILKDSFREQLLEEIDGFQGRFIKEDERMSLLRNNIAEVDKWLNKELPGERKPIQLIERQLKNLGDNISISKTEFNKLKSGFTHFIMVNRL